MDTRSRLPAGTLLDGSYRIEGVIGAGGFGITYRAEDVNLKTTVALKEYYPEEYGDRARGTSVQPKSERHRTTFEWGLASFMREAQLLARFRHPGVVRVSRVFEANDTAYMVMDFEEGRSFTAWVDGLGRAPTQAELDRLCATLLDALEAMHKQGVLHRDIAPDNIIVRPDGEPVLLDFGAARRAIGEMSRSLTRIIKAGFSPSEQYASDARLQGPWTDIYALGGTLYLAVAGRPPDDAPSRLDGDGMMPAVRAGRRGYRPGFLAAIDACLGVRASTRPQSVAELRPLLLGTQDAAPGRGKAMGAGAPARRGRRVAVAAAAAALLAAVGYAGFAMLAEPPSQPIASRADAPRAMADVKTAAVADQKSTAPAAPPVPVASEPPRPPAAEERAAREAAAAPAGDTQAREAESGAGEAATRIEASARDSAPKAAAVSKDDKPPAAAAAAPKEAPKAALVAPPVPVPPAPSKRAFDGHWQVSTTATNEFCTYQSGNFMLAVKEGVIRGGGAGRHHGTISPEGNLVMLGPARANPDNTVRFSAKVAGEQGRGSYRVLQGKCVGVFTLRKLS